MQASVGRSPVSHLLERAATLPPLPEGVEDLAWDQFFKMPVGPKGLEPSARLRELEGKRVRLVGYFVFEDWGTCNCAPEPAQEPGAPVRRRAPAWLKHVIPGRIMLAPLPATVSLGHFALCDDLPPQTVYVTVKERFGEPVLYRPGLFAMTGVLQLGNREEPDGRTSYVHLLLDREADFVRAGQLAPR